MIQIYTATHIAWHKYRYPHTTNSGMYTHCLCHYTISKCPLVHFPLVRFGCTSAPPTDSTSFIQSYVPDHSITECVHANTMRTLRSFLSLFPSLQLAHASMHTHIVSTHNLLHAHRTNHNVPNPLFTTLYCFLRFW